ncbi:hypothetical protein VTO73DRAFT_821 [Trametes versicolor]
MAVSARKIVLELATVSFIPGDSSFAKSRLASRARGAHLPAAYPDHATLAPTKLATALLDFHKSTLD